VSARGPVRRLIVDGYNVIRGSRRYATVADDLDAARERLIADLGARVADGDDVTVVFDGGGNPQSDGRPRSVGGVSVIFSASGTDADTVIEALAAEARDLAQETIVVTSDVATRWTAVGGSVAVGRSALFGDELAADEEAWREHAVGPRRNPTVGDRIDPGTNARMERMRRHKGG
jgi:predicted RNA-binding protein with PIN domain